MSDLLDLTKRVREVRNLAASWPADRCPVCGWPFSENGCQPGDCSMRPMPEPKAVDDTLEYATDIRDAWVLVELLEAEDLRWILNTWPDGRKEFTIYKPVKTGQEERWKRLASGMGETPAAAICNGWLELEERRAAEKAAEQDGVG